MYQRNSKVRNGFLWFLPIVASVLCLFLTGCEGIQGVPYRSGTAAAKIYESSLADSKLDRDSYHTSRIVVPVIAGDHEVGSCLRFSPVQVDISESNRKRLLTAYCEVSPQIRVWKVSLVKNDKEYYHFLTANKVHLLADAVPLDPLALDPTLPIPDKIVVTAVNTEEEWINRMRPIKRDDGAKSELEYQKIKSYEEMPLLRDKIPG
jgi:hypothetical protein